MHNKENQKQTTYFVAKYIKVFKSQISTKDIVANWHLQFQYQKPTTDTISKTNTKMNILCIPL